MGERVSTTNKCPVFWLGTNPAQTCQGTETRSRVALIAKSERRHQKLLGAPSHVRAPSKPQGTNMSKARNGRGEMAGLFFWGSDLRLLFLLVFKSTAFWPETKQQLVVPH
jgi:hypothetical protein